MINSKKITSKNLGTTAGLLLSGALLLPAMVIADQQPDTLDAIYGSAGPEGDYYADDPEGEHVYTLIANVDPDITIDNNVGGGSILVCGTNACATDSMLEEGGYESRDGSLGGYAEVTILEDGPTGSGMWDPFLRQQHNEQEGNGFSTIETAYNTNNDDLQSLSDPTPTRKNECIGEPGTQCYQNQAKDTGAGGDPDFNHAILWDESLEDGGKLNFLLDINEAESTSEILLDELSFFVSTSDMLNLYDPDCDYDTDGLPTTSTGNNTDGSHGCFLDSTTADGEPIPGGDAIKVWDLDIDKLMAAIMLDNTNSTGKAGSGDYDAIFSLDASLFTGAMAALDLDGFTNGTTDFYIYLENTMGLVEPILENEEAKKGNPCPGKNSCSPGTVDAGFEEWAIVQTSSPDNQVPIPSTAFLIAIGGLALLRRRFN